MLTLTLFAMSLGIFGVVMFWPRKPQPIEYEEREFLNGKLMVPKD